MIVPNISDKELETLINEAVSQVGEMIAKGQSSGPEFKKAWNKWLVLSKEGFRREEEAKKEPCCTCGRSIPENHKD